MILCRNWTRIHLKYLTERLFFRTWSSSVQEPILAWFQMCGDVTQAGFCVCVWQSAGKNGIYTLRNSVCSWPQWKASAWYPPNTACKQDQVLAFTVSLQKAQSFSKSLNFKQMQFHFKDIFYTYIHIYIDNYTSSDLAIPLSYMHQAADSISKVRGLCKYLFIAPGASSRVLHCKAASIVCSITPCVQKLLKV